MKKPNVNPIAVSCNEFVVYFVERKTKDDTSLYRDLCRKDVLASLRDVLDLAIEHHVYCRVEVEETQKTSFKKIGAILTCWLCNYRLHRADLLISFNAYTEAVIFLILYQLTDLFVQNNQLQIIT